MIQKYLTLDEIMQLMKQVPEWKPAISEEGYLCWHYHGQIKELTVYLNKNKYGFTIGIIYKKEYIGLAENLKEKKFGELLEFYKKVEQEYNQRINKEKEQRIADGLAMARNLITPIITS